MLWSVLIYKPAECKKKKKKLKFIMKVETEGVLNMADISSNPPRVCCCLYMCFLHVRIFILLWMLWRGKTSTWYHLFMLSSLFLLLVCIPSPTNNQHWFLVTMTTIFPNQAVLVVSTKPDVSHSGGRSDSTLTNPYEYHTYSLFGGWGMWTLCAVNVHISACSYRKLATFVLLACVYMFMSAQQ